MKRAFYIVGNGMALVDLVIALVYYISGNTSKSTWYMVNAILLLILFRQEDK